jgi:serine/threonine-protein kinase
MPSLIVGKWHQHRYDVERELGRGANGTVYLANKQGSNQRIAIKVGEDVFSITSEVNVLRQFGQARGGILGPSVYDVDDWELDGKTLPFYVMNVIEGTPVPQFVKKRGQEWVPVFIIQLLDFLHNLHKEGWIFGDLKPENLSISGHPPKLAWFDAGGITKRGRAIKEYTEAYDRGYWQLGNRRAEPSYDLFSTAIIFLQLHYQKLLQPQEAPRETLQDLIFSEPALYPYQAILWKAIEGGYHSAGEMRREMVQAWHYQKGGKIKIKGQKPFPPADKRKKSGSFATRMITMLFTGTLMVFLFTLYLFIQAL